MTRIERMTGPACAERTGVSALRQLRARIGTGPLQIMPGTISTSLHLPGGAILLDRALVEDFEEPAVVAGYALAEQTLSEARDPLRALLETLGLGASLQLVTTGGLKGDVLDSYAEHLLTLERVVPDDEMLLQAFATRSMHSTAYAYARDVTGETVLSLIEGDPMTGKPAAELLSDADWLRLQSICGG